MSLSIHSILLVAERSATSFIDTYYKSNATLTYDWEF